MSYIIIFMFSFDKFSQSKFVVVFSCLKKPRILQGFLFFRQSELIL